MARCPGATPATASSRRRRCRSTARARRAGDVVDPGSAHPAADEPADDDLGPIPWHLKLLAGALAVYLGWRAWQGIEWVAHNL